MEKELPVGTPALVYTDVHVVAGDASSIASSYYGYYRRNPRANHFSRALCQCFGLGCTMLANQALCGLALPVPDRTAMHDSWIALVASAFGKITYVDEATSLYRQHGSNTGGGVRRVPLYVRLLRAARGMTDRERYRALLQRRYNEAEAFVERFDAVLTPELREIATAFCRVPRTGPLERRLTLAKYGFLKSSLLDNVEMFVRI